jgi:hypothetical protein
MIDRHDIRMVFLPSAIRRQLVDAPWAQPAQFKKGRLVHVLVGNTVAVKAEWHSIPQALEALSDIEMMRVNHGVAVNMNLFDVPELEVKAPRLGFEVYHERTGKRTDFVRISRRVARLIRRRT